MAFSKNLEEVWRWKEEIAQETKNLSAEEQIEYFRRASRKFLDKSSPPLKLPICEKPSIVESVKK